MHFIISFIFLIIVGVIGLVCMMFHLGFLTMMAIVGYTLIAFWALMFLSMFVFIAWLFRWVINMSTHRKA